MSYAAVQAYRLRGNGISLHSIMVMVDAKKEAFFDALSQPHQVQFKEGVLGYYRTVFKFEASEPNHI